MPVGVQVTEQRFSKSQKVRLYKMKGGQKRKQNGFKAGHVPLYRKTVHTNEHNSEEKSVQYLRLPKDEHKLVSEAGPGVEGVASHDSGFKLLRPTAGRKSKLEVASEKKNER